MGSQEIQAGEKEMRTVLIEKQVYKFDELDEKAKDKVRETFADDVWYDCRYEDFSEIATILGITFNTCERGKHTDISIWWSGFYRQGDGLSFDGMYSYSKKAPKRMKAYCNNPELIAMAQELQDIQKPFAKATGYSIAFVVTGHGCKEDSVVPYTGVDRRHTS
jgi:hypothetical protein